MLVATRKKVVERLRLTLTEFSAKKEPTTISAAIRPYSIAVTPEESSISLLNKIIIGRLHLGFNHAQRPLKSLIEP